MRKRVLYLVGAVSLCLVACGGKQDVVDTTQFATEEATEAVAPTNSYAEQIKKGEAISEFETSAGETGNSAESTGTESGQGSGSGASNGSGETGSGLVTSGGNSGGSGLEVKNRAISVISESEYEALPEESKAEAGDSFLVEVEPQNTDELVEYAKEQLKTQHFDGHTNAGQVLCENYDWTVDDPALVAELLGMDSSKIDEAFMDAASTFLDFSFDTFGFSWESTEDSRRLAIAIGYRLGYFDDSYLTQWGADKAAMDAMLEVYGV